jgi:hypothetical protein
VLQEWSCNPEALLKYPNWMLQLRNKAERLACVHCAAEPVHVRTPRTHYRIGAKEWAGDDFCLSGGSAGGIPDNRVPRLHVELLARVLVAVGGIVAYAPVELKRLV